ncbi:hypothetical protein [Phormidium tenue]|uniref:Uncharacterized protein n=1 Tax=Phormidium tenue FACHB-1050 TaxID=2692857 RepID=A0ABR8CI22_9CYAN|nr:hypothetical protein [Phormidium tenue]MBD2319963.1 hypothetical protein [Phormidium tenue FACHB-1050]
MYSFNSTTKLKQYRHSSIFAHQLFSLPIKVSSRIVDRAILAREGDRHE